MYIVIRIREAAQIKRYNPMRSVLKTILFEPFFSSLLCDDDKDNDDTNKRKQQQREQDDDDDADGLELDRKT